MTQWVGFWPMMSQDSFTAEGPLGKVASPQNVQGAPSRAPYFILNWLLTSVGLTMSLMGLSSSISMGTLVLWIQVFVHKCLSLTYEFLQGKKGVSLLLPVK